MAAQVISDDVKKLANEIAEWRRQKQVRSESMPSVISKKVGILARKFPAKFLSKQLGLDVRTVTKLSATTKKPFKHRVKKPTLIEVSGLIHKQNHSGHAEIIHPNGIRLVINNDDILDKVLQQFWRGAGL